MTKYCKEIADRIVDGIAQDKSFARIARELKICQDTITDWLRKHEEFAEACTRARIPQAEVIAAKITQIHEDLNDGIIEPDKARVMLAALQWSAAKRNPRLYGDKTILSNDPDSPIGSLALRLDTAINGKIIDITPEPAQISHLPANNDCSDLA